VTEELTIRVPPSSQFMDDENNDDEGVPVIIPHEAFTDKGFWITPFIKPGSLFRATSTTNAENGKPKHWSSFNLKLDNAMVHAMDDDDDEKKDIDENSNNEGSKRAKVSDFA